MANTFEYEVNSWDSKKYSIAVKAAKKYYALFGPPAVAEHKVIIWNEGNLKKNKIYGLPICFDALAVMCKTSDPITMTKKVDVQSLINQQIMKKAALPKIYSAAIPLVKPENLPLGKYKSCVMFPPKVGISVCSDSLDKTLIILKNVVYALKTGNAYDLEARIDKEIGNSFGSFVMSKVSGSPSNPDPEVMKKCYIELCGLFSSELFSDSPWYARNYDASNNPLDIMLSEISDRDYYHDINRFNVKKYGDLSLSKTVIYPSIFGTDCLTDTAACTSNFTVYPGSLSGMNGGKNPGAYPKAPGAKPTPDNYVGKPTEDKKVEMLLNMNPKCKGACANRYARKAAAENLISYGAYSGIVKKKSI